MAHRILFSPVGGHDPIANFRDGAVLHICRVYKPERVYLYLSHEMLERSRMDDRYRRSLEKLREHVNGAIQEIHLIERDELTQVQRFDAFYTDFDQLLRQIHEAFPDSELLLNLLWYAGDEERPQCHLCAFALSYAGDPGFYTKPERKSQR